jgi:hypothetical protein
MVLNIFLETAPGSNRFVNTEIVFSTAAGKEPPDNLLQAARFGKDFFPDEEITVSPGGRELFGVLLRNGVPGERCLVGLKSPDDN